MPIGMWWTWTHCLPMTLLQLFWVSGNPMKLEVSIHESPDTSRSKNLEAVPHEVQGRSRGNNFKMEITSKIWKKKQVKPRFTTTSRAITSIK